MFIVNRSAYSELDWLSLRHDNNIGICVVTDRSYPYALIVATRARRNEFKMAIFWSWRSSFSIQLCLLLLMSVATESSQQQTAPPIGRSTFGFNDIWKLLTEHKESVIQVIDKFSSSPPFSEEPELLRSVKDLLDNVTGINSNSTECDNCTVSVYDFAHHVSD